MSDEQTEDTGVLREHHLAHNQPAYEQPNIAKAMTAYTIGPIARAKQELAEGRLIWRRPSIERMIAEYDSLADLHQTVAAQLERAQLRLQQLDKLEDARYRPMNRSTVLQNFLNVGTEPAPQPLTIVNIQEAIRKVESLPRAERPKEIRVNSIPEFISAVIENGYTSDMHIPYMAEPQLESAYFFGIPIIERWTVPPGKFLVLMQDNTFQVGAFETATDEPEGYDPAAELVDHDNEDPEE